MIESKPAVICQFFKLHEKKVSFLYFMKTHHPALVQSIEKKNDGEGGQLLRLESIIGVFIADSGRGVVRSWQEPLSRST